LFFDFTRAPNNRFHPARRSALLSGRLTPALKDRPDLSGKMGLKPRGGKR